MCISNKISPPVVCDDFFGRKFTRQTDCLIVAILFTVRTRPLAKCMIEEKKNQGWICVYIDLEETITEDGFLNLVIEAFCKNGIRKQVAKGTSKV